MSTTPRRNQKTLHRFSTEQTQELLTVFKTTICPSRKQRDALGAKFGCEQRKVQVWFQNQRQKLNLTKKKRRFRKPRIDYVYDIKEKENDKIRKTYSNIDKLLTDAQRITLEGRTGEFLIIPLKPSTARRLRTTEDDFRFSEENRKRLKTSKTTQTTKTEPKPIVAKKENEQMCDNADLFDKARKIDSRVVYRYRGDVDDSTNSSCSHYRPCFAKVDVQCTPPPLELGIPFGFPCVDLWSHNIRDPQMNYMDPCSGRTMYRFDDLEIPGLPIPPNVRFNGDYKEEKPSMKSLSEEMCVSMERVEKSLEFMCGADSCEAH